MTQEWNSFVQGVYSILLHRKLTDFSKEWQKFLQTNTKNMESLGQDLYTVKQDLGKMTDELSAALSDTLRAFFNERKNHHE